MKLLEMFEKLLLLCLQLTDITVCSVITKIAIDFVLIFEYQRVMLLTSVHDILI